MRGDYQAALIAKVIADANSKKGRNKFANFLLKWARTGRAEVSNGGGRFDEDEQAGDSS